MEIIREKINEIESEETVQSFEKTNSSDKPSESCPRKRRKH